ncbi:hypothetical protein [Streptosporangium sp. KLBMP 9127]|nr:hypothetical protein [Streptosporangium sp. KLBMP 9127]
MKKKIAVLLGTTMVSMAFVATLAAPAHAASWHWFGPVSKSVCNTKAEVWRDAGYNAKCNWTPYGYYWGYYS